MAEVAVVPAAAVVVAVAAAAERTLAAVVAVVAGSAAAAAAIVAAAVALVAEAPVVAAAAPTVGADAPHAAYTDVHVMAAAAVVLACMSYLAEPSEAKLPPQPSFFVDLGMPALTLGLSLEEISLHFSVPACLLAFYSSGQGAPQYQGCQTELRECCLSQQHRTLASRCPPCRTPGGP